MPPEAPGFRSKRRRGEDAVPKPFHVDDMGDDALRFAKWFLHNKFKLMEGFASELARDPDARDGRALRARFASAVQHGQRVLVARLVVTVLLAFGVVTTVVATVLGFVYVPLTLAGEVATVTRLLERVAAIAASFSVVLMALRLAFDRYLNLVDVSATFIGMQLAGAPEPE